MSRSAGWTEVSVEEIKAEQPNALATGPFGSSISSKYFKGSGVPVIRGGNLSEDVGSRLDLKDLVFLSPEKAEEFRRSIVEKGDLIFTCWGTVGQVGLIDEKSPFSEYVISNKQMKLTPDPRKADSLFLYYLFSGPEMSGRIKAEAIGSSVPGFNLTQLRSLRLCLPSLVEQQAIAEVLGALDEKIYLNRGMNQTLEAVARATFKSWFVDFDPVREGRLGFPRELASSDRGLVPKGWSILDLGDWVEVIDCLHSKKPERRMEGQALLQLANIRDDGLLDMTDTYWISEEDYQLWISRMEASSGDCVITNVGRVGAVAQVPDGLRAALGRNMTGLRCRREFFFPTFLIETLRSSRMREEIERRTDSGTILDSLNVRNIPRLQAVVPDRRVAEIFEEQCRPLRALMEKNLEASRTLATLRDTLLPKLLSGEIRVKQAEKMVGEAV